MTVRNVRTRNWSVSTTNSNSHHHNRVHNGRSRWMLVVVILISVSLFIIILLMRTRSSQSYRNDFHPIIEFPGQKSNEGLSPSDHKVSHRWSTPSSFSLHRLYTASRNRFRHSNDHIPIHSLLYRTYQQQQQQQREEEEEESRRTHKKQGTTQQSPPVPSQQHRIAMLLPYTTTPSSPEDSNNYVSILSYFSLFCYSVAGTADIMDFYIFHTGIIHPSREEEDNDDVDYYDIIRNQTMLQHCPPNVIFINLQNHYGLAKYLLRVVDVKYNTINMEENPTTTNTEDTNTKPTTQHKPPAMKYNELLDLIESYIKMNPYGLVEFKPALGHIFSDYINGGNNYTTTTTTKYTHWGYTDFDTVFGDISRWLTHDELNNYDIITYTFGDQQRLYVRGQFTIHKNIPNTINQLWRHCSYLSNLDERFESIVQQQTKYHVESAEGCYSAVLLNQTNISIKFAVKAWTDIYNDDTAHTHGVAIAQSPISGRQVLYKLEKDEDDTASNSEIINSSQLFYNLRSSWFENDDTIYHDRSIDLQRPIGARIRLHDPYDNDDTITSDKSKKKKPCMYWALAKYQSKLCLKDGIVTSNDIVYYINGVLYKQEYENVPIFPADKKKHNVITAPLFHFQEWKRSYRYEQVAPIYSSLLSSASSSSSLLNTNNNDINTFLLTHTGVIPMISSSSGTTTTKLSTKGVISSPLSLTDMKVWESTIHLPLATYCIRSRLDGSRIRTKCDTAISYHDTGRVTILSRAPEWTNVNIDSDVTLVLTLQFLASWNIETNERLVQNVIDNTKMNIERWYGQPCVLVISIPMSFHEKTLEHLRRQFDSETNPNFSSCFILTLSHDLIQEQNDADTISRKALLNMAIDIVPTRWYVSGIELERGLVISMDTSYITHRTAETYSTMRGNIFLIPQFGIIDRENETSDESKLDFDEIIRLKRSSKVHPLGEEWDSDCSDHEDSLNDLSKLIDDIWMAESLLLTGSMTSDVEPDVVNTKIIRDIETVQRYFLQMVQDGMDENYEDTEMYTYHESPILLTDNLGLYDGIRTSEIVREVEAFASIRCYNIVRLNQMILMNYTLNVLPLAFVSKSPFATIISSEMQEQQQHRKPKRCPTMCTNFLDDDEPIINEIAQNEIQRAAMTVVVWDETIRDKHS